VDVQAQTVTYGDVEAAAKRIEGVARRTPVLNSRTLDVRAGAHVFLKCENFQRTGSFKFRGAYNRIAGFTPAEREAGVIAVSSGNHAQGVALAAKLLDVRATIVMPHDAPASKIEATRAYGAEIVFYDRAAGDREAIARALQNERGGTFVPPFDDARIIAGAGTAALELIDEVETLDVLIVCLGGGGLLAGSCIALREHAPQAAIYGSEPQAGDDWVRSLAAGERVTIPVPDTLADGAMTTAPGAITFPIVQRCVRDVVTVTDQELCDAMRFAFERLKIVVEPTGVLALAALLSRKVEVQGARVGVIVSGGNVDRDAYTRALERGASVT
jgi:threonine dehydratase